jgi:hypothetical protein
MCINLLRLIEDICHLMNEHFEMPAGKSQLGETLVQMCWGLLSWFRFRRYVYVYVTIIAVRHGCEFSV